MAHPLESEFVGAVERLRPSVVRIRRKRTGRFGGPDGSEAAGTGVVLDPRGYVVTNDHVVRSSQDLKITLDDGRETHGAVVGEDPATDLALVRIDGRDVPAARFADSERLRVGQFALAIGNSLGLPGGPTVSFGVISAIGRPLPGADHVLEGLIQTDAAINPGNSGGPLADLDGAVVGLNSSVVPFAQGVGFAIPSNTVRAVAEQILSAGRVVRPWIGISGVGADAGLARRFGLARTSGVLLAEVRDDGPSARAGLRPGDLLLRIGPYAVRGLRDLIGALAKLPIGGAVDFEYARGAELKRGVLRIAEAPPYPLPE